MKGGKKRRKQVDYYCARLAACLWLPWMYVPAQYMCWQWLWGSLLHNCTVKGCQWQNSHRRQRLQQRLCFSHPTGNLQGGKLDITHLSHDNLLDSWSIPCFQEQYASSLHWECNWSTLCDYWVHWQVRGCSKLHGIDGLGAWSFRSQLYLVHGIFHV